MYWDNLPDDLIKYIMVLRKYYTCKTKAATIIQSTWKTYKIKILVNRFINLRYLLDFRIWNPTIYEFLLRARL